MFERGNGKGGKKARDFSERRLITTLNGENEKEFGNKEVPWSILVLRIFLESGAVKKTTMGEGGAVYQFGGKTPFYVVKVKVNASDSSFVVAVEYGGKRDRWADR